MAVIKTLFHHKIACSCC